jgi:hypothetical protein
MTLENTLRRQLSNPEPGGFHVSADGWDVTLAAEKRDSLSCALSSLTLERRDVVQADLHVWATQIAERATGLIEPLKVVEIDQTLGKAMLRSAAPTVTDDKAHYYELLLERTHRSVAELRRYAADRLGAQKREAVPFVLTHDAIVKLAVDIAGAGAKR